MSTHELKTDPAYFVRLLDGSKTFDIRKDDRGFQAGDWLVLREYDRSRLHECVDSTCEDNRWTGRLLHKRVGFVAKGTLFGLALGEFAILSLLEPDDDRYAPKDET